LNRTQPCTLMKPTLTIAYNLKNFVYHFLLIDNAQRAFDYPGRKSRRTGICNLQSVRLYAVYVHQKQCICNYFVEGRQKIPHRAESSVSLSMMNDEGWWDNGFFFAHRRRYSNPHPRSWFRGKKRLGSIVSKTTPVVFIMMGAQLRIHHKNIGFQFT